MKPLMFLNAQKPSSMYLTGTRVDEIMDANGSGRSVATSASLSTAYNPTYNSALFGGRGGISFNGAQYLESPAAFPELNWTRGFTILIAGTYKSGFFAAADSVAIICGAGMGARLGIGTYGCSWQGLPLTPCIFGLSWDGFSKATLILNGESFTFTEGSFSNSIGPFGKLQVGGIIGAGSSMSFDMAGMKIWSECLDSQDVQVESDLMADCFGITYQTTPNYNIVVDGNSLAVGYFGYDTTTMWDGIRAITGMTPLDVINVANSGLETPSMHDRAALTTDIHLNQSIPHKRRVLIVWEITNDLANLTQTDAGAYANIKNYCQARVAAGWRVVVCTCLPRTQTGINANFETYRLSVNSSINANAISEGWASAIADIGGDATIGATGASDNTTYYLDKIHLTAAGHSIAKTYITSALTSIL
jgi:hypothetical protein